MVMLILQEFTRFKMAQLVLIVKALDHILMMLESGLKNMVTFCIKLTLRIVLSYVILVFLVAKCIIKAFLMLKEQRYVVGKSKMQINDEMMAKKVKVTDKFEEIYSKYKEFRYQLMSYYYKLLYDSAGEKIIIGHYIEAGNKVNFDMSSCTITEMLDFLPNLRESIDHVRSLNRVPILLSFIPSPESDYEFIFMISVEKVID
ncbi:hypothetical protein [Nostoc phage N1]|nr:hypothetical protein [Nostoc phage N1]